LIPYLSSVRHAGNSCGFGKSAENCCVCGEWFDTTKHEAMLGNCCGFGSDKDKCVKCDGYASQKVPAFLCKTCGFGSEKDKCAKLISGGSGGQSSSSGGGGIIGNGGYDGLCPWTKRGMTEAEWRAEVSRAREAEEKRAAEKAPIKLTPKELGLSSKKVYCPNCDENVTSKITEQECCNGARCKLCALTCVLSVLQCNLTYFICLPCLPCICWFRKDTTHSCPKCDSILGVHKPFDDYGNNE